MAKSTKPTRKIVVRSVGAQLTEAELRQVMGGDVGLGLRKSGGGGGSSGVTHLYP